MVAAAFAASASAAPSGLDAAIDAWLEDDFSQMHIIERHADAGDAAALGVLGQACYYGLGCARDRARAVGLMTRAAEGGDLPSMVQLGRIYEYGSSDVPADAALAARWFLSAAEAGDTISAPAALQRLPRETVIAAGGSAWLDGGAAATAPATLPAPTAEPALPAQAALNPPPQPVPAPAPIAATPPAPAPEAEPTPPDPGTTLTIASLFGISTSAPEPLRLRDGTAFPIYVSSNMGPRGDAAASCLLDLDPAIDAKMAELETLAARARSQDAVGRLGTTAQMDVLQAEIRTLMLARRSANQTLEGLPRTSGLTEDAINLAFSFHIDASKSRPETGPGADICRRHYIALDAQLLTRELQP